MSIDMLQEKIRKLKNPSMVELMLPLAALPPRYAHDAKGYGEFCRDLLGGLKGIVPAVRLSFGAFALLGGEGLQELAQTLNTARNMGYYTVLDAPELTHGSAGAPARSDIEFRHVTFAYAQSEGPALKDISFHVPEGAALALVGPSGSGKSTAAKLLAGYFDAQEGEILMGGTPISECSQEALCEKIAYVEQETFLFEGTILENIRMGRQTASDAEVMDAARRAGCDAFIRALPNGYQTEAGAAGGRLSGGERQRIAIARAILKDAPILILDEATASADPKNEAAIQQALSAAVAGKTLIVIAHRLSTVCNADQLAFFRDGRIIATGTHAQLLKNCEDYAAMWRLSEEAQL